MQWKWLCSLQFQLPSKLTALTITDLHSGDIAAAPIGHTPIISHLNDYNSYLTSFLLLSLPLPSSTVHESIRIKLLNAYLIVLLLKTFK